MTWRWLLCVPMVLAGVWELRADDWPQWLGPQRDSVWRETGVVDVFPKAGLPIKWRVPVGLGYAGPAVVGDHVYLLDYVKSTGEVANNPSARIELTGEERISCFDIHTGKQLWVHAYPCNYKLSYPSGPRCTPTVSDGRVYALGAEGRLTCLDAKTGELVWAKELTVEYETETPIWGFAAHPLVHGDLLYCVVGGKGSVAVAFKKDTGAEVWRALSADSAGYCPPSIIQHGGREQLLIWHPFALNALEPKTGNVIWSEPLQPGYEMSVTAPTKSGDRLFASGIQTVGAMYQLDAAGKADVLWRGKSKTALYSCNSPPFFHQGTVYGADCQVGSFVAFNAEDGKRLWETFQPTSNGTRRASHGTSYVVQHGDRFFLFSETGDLILARLSPEKYEEISRFHVLDPTNECFGRKVVWSHPAYASRCCFARNDKELVCVDLKK